jgi:hypothetical protein
MEKAKWKDSIKSVWSHVAKGASLLLPKSKDERTITINFVLLRSPLLDFGDPDTIVVSRKSGLYGTRLREMILFMYQRSSVLVRPFRKFFGTLAVTTIVHVSPSSRTLTSI